MRIFTDTGTVTASLHSRTKLKTTFPYKNQGSSKIHNTRMLRCTHCRYELPFILKKRSIVASTGDPLRTSEIQIDTVTVPLYYLCRGRKQFWRITTKLNASLYCAFTCATQGLSSSENSKALARYFRSFMNCLLLIIGVKVTCASYFLASMRQANSLWSTIGARTCLDHSVKKLSLILLTWPIWRNSDLPVPHAEQDDAPDALDLRGNCDIR